MSSDSLPTPEPSAGRFPGSAPVPAARPSGPRDLRASDADRERVVALLGEAVVDGRLSAEEHEQRVAEAYAARTLGQLTRLTTDLVAPSAQPVQTEPRSALAFFGEDRRAGRWVVPERFSATAAFGTVTLDLCEALLRRRQTTIYATAIFGTVELVVPEGVVVRITGPAVLGSHVEVVPVAARPDDAPEIYVRAFSLLGTVRARNPRRRRGLRRGYGGARGRDRRRGTG